MKNENQKYKTLNQFEYHGLKSLLEHAFPFFDNEICGTTNEGLINIQNSYTENAPNDKFCFLGSAGISHGNDIVLSYWDENGNESFDYWISVYDIRSFENGECFSALLNKIV